jgi:hypothetical protein
MIEGGLSPSGDKHSNLCTNVVKYKNSSILAKDSPRQTLRPKNEHKLYI